ncbi:MAG: hypothetical protein JW996_06650, partial [Candidatus Cloacimonetes bacterium]|nr:hypothetical protein [Candidatus Cloacimonadota bacterium]
PSVATPEGNRFSTPFWIDKDDQYTAINSSDLNIYMHWGWNGEYKNNDPNDRKNNDVLDENSNTTYFSEIIYFDLRLDGEAFVYPPLPPAMFNITDSTGSWLRVPVNFDIGQTAILYGLVSGEHVFEVRAVDLQLIPDPTPATFTFYLYDPIPLESKSGILIIDDDPHNNNNCPDDSTDALYEYFVSDYTGEVVQFDRVQWANTNSVYHFGRSKFSPTDLIPYELIIYHSDDPTVSTNIVSEYDPLYLYLRGGGNMILSGGARLKDAQEQMIEGYYMLFDRYFGLPLPIGSDQDTAGQITQVSWNGTNGAFQTLQFFQFARAEATGYTDIHLQIPSFNILLNLQGHEGLGPVCYFDNLTPGTEIYYSFGCRDEIEEEEDTDYLPNQAQYDFFNGKPVGIKYSTAITKCFTFGFPLSYMDKDEVKAKINRILIELGMM